MGAAECSACLAGSYADAAGMSSCTNCPGGTANPSSGSTSSSDCQQCAAGTVAWGQVLHNDGVCEDDDVTLDSVGVGLGLHAGDLTCESLVHDYGGAEICFAGDSDLALPENAAWLGGREYYPGIFAMEICCSACSSVDWYDDGDYAFDHGDYAFDHVDGVDGASECDVCPAGTHANALGTE
ncbi:hypothetical protein TeGR_g13042 [Tetraparma gracilis]|uniref:Tyrosine-protein kinase ephrin type A/B receptor-like domain-containing protein n=1 Tax=Tetraparma gracilis TaxID=2962635 RepID=A0ABQ6MW02_9STRA|nr:hypothetical protein TeGR_g13042 [Tetraparma gracilis]